MAHSFATDFRLDDLDPALLADDASVAHPFVFATITLIVFGRSKYFCAKQPVTLRFKRSIINGFRLLDLAMGPRADHLFGRQRDLDRIKTERILGFFEKTQKIFHFVLTSPYWFSSSSSTLSARLWSSRIITLNDSGSPGSRTFSPLTIASYIRVRPATSSDLTVSISCRLYAAP